MFQLHNSINTCQMTLSSFYVSYKHKYLCNTFSYNIIKDSVILILKLLPSCNLLIVKVVLQLWVILFKPFSSYFQPQFWKVKLIILLSTALSDLTPGHLRNNCKNTTLKNLSFDFASSNKPKSVQTPQFFQGPPSCMSHVVRECELTTQDHNKCYDSTTDSKQSP